ARGGDGHARQFAVMVHVRHGERLNVLTAPRAQPDHTRQHAEFVIDQHRQRMAARFMLYDGNVVDDIGKVFGLLCHYFPFAALSARSCTAISWIICSMPPIVPATLRISPARFTSPAASNCRALACRLVRFSRTSLASVS